MKRRRRERKSNTRNVGKEIKVRDGEQKAKNCARKVFERGEKELGKRKGI